MEDKTMNKKILVTLLCFIAVVSIVGVSAANLNEDHDFNGLFSMKVASDDNFTQIGDPNAYSSLLKSTVAYGNQAKSIYVFYYGNYGLHNTLEMLSSNSINENDAVKDGNLTLFNSTSAVDTQLTSEGCNLTTFAAIESKDSTVVVGGSDANLVKEYANTIQVKK